MSRTWILCLTAALAAGCGSSPAYRTPQASLKKFGLVEAPAAVPVPGHSKIDRPGRAPTEQEIANELRARPKLARPARLALVELAYSGELPAARPVGPEELDAFRQACKASSPFQTVESVPDFLLPQEISLASLRYSAARTQADLLLLVTRATETYDYDNHWSNLYLTVIGWFVVPGNSQEVHAHAEAALVDVRSGQVLGVTSAAEKSLHRLLPLASNRSSLRELVAENSRALMAALAARTLELTKTLGG